MPISSIKIGIDLDPIKPIPGVTTFQCDITTEQCRHLIRKEIKHLKADVVLHDGAPNVGGQWAKDSYNQNELVLYSIKLASEFLKEGGWFISKVFRSIDYNSLLYVMKQLFDKVEATKPLASRTQAAEIFVICQGYKNPSYIDPKLLDPKYALKQIDDEDTMKNNTINSIKAMFDRKKNRSGYNTDTLFIVKSFKDFIDCSNPFKFLFETNKIKVETEDCKKYVEIIKNKPKDYELYFDDLQVLGKKEMEELIIWRNKIRTKLNLSRKENIKEKEEEKEKKEKDINEEMDEEIKKYEKQRKKRLEAQKRKQEKIELSNKKAFILQEDQPQDNDVDNDDELYEYMQKKDIDIENLEEPKEEKDENEDKDNLGEFNEVNFSDLSEDDYIDMMNDDIEQNKKLYEEEKELARKKKKDKKEKKKKKGEIELVKNDNEDEDDLLLDKDLDDDEEEENEGDDSDLYYDDDQDDEIDDEDKNEINLDENEEEDLKDDILIKNPLRKEKKKKVENKDNKENKKEKKKEKKEEENEEDNLSYDSDEKEEEKKENELLKKKKNRSNEKNDISSSDSENDGYNSDDKAEIRAIAKKMLRKKERIKILNSSYNRYAFEDDEKVPKWFLEEESKHNKPQKPITKAEVLAEKEFLKKITVRMPKKVLEAKARKRNRLNKRLQKIKKQAENIANQDEYTEISKVKQIEKLYKREINKSKDKKRYIISRSWSNNKGKDSRNVRHVDRRLKKDKRALKAREKRNKKYKRRH
jgi:AdoMet-dependent rRNA methyltransferase SPB1